MIINDVTSQSTHQPIESQSRMLFEERIGFPLTAHTIYNIHTFIIIVDHGTDSIHIVLQVRIYRNTRVGMGRRPFQSCPKRMLMSHIVCQFQSFYIRIFFSISPDQAPCSVFAPIVHIKNHPMVDSIPFQQTIEHTRQLKCGFRQYRFFVITRNYDYKFHSTIFYV